MQIVKKPRFKECECKVCGTVFIPDIYDELHYKWKDPANFYEHEIFTRCPACSQFVQVFKFKES